MMESAWDERLRRSAARSRVHVPVVIARGAAVVLTGMVTSEKCRFKLWIG